LIEFKIAETETFSKQINKIGNRNIYNKITSYIYPQIRSNPFYGLNIKKLEGDLSAVYRYRIGDYRLFYIVDQEKELVIILSINNRKESYKKK
jgi:mRNA interferase RelE/StbE